MSEEIIDTAAPEETETAEQPAEETESVDAATSTDTSIVDINVDDVDGTPDHAPEDTLEEVLEEEFEEQVYLPGGTVSFTENGNTIYSTREP